MNFLLGGVRHNLKLVAWLLVAGAIGVAGGMSRSHFLLGLSIVLIGMTFVSFVWGALQRGKFRPNVSGYRITVYRDQNPIVFWLYMVVYGLGSLCFIGVGIAMMLRLLTPPRW